MMKTVVQVMMRRRKREEGEEEEEKYEEEDDEQEKEEDKKKQKPKRSVGSKTKLRDGMIGVKRGQQGRRSYFLRPMAPQRH